MSVNQTINSLGKFLQNLKSCVQNFSVHFLIIFSIPPEKKLFLVDDKSNQIDKFHALDKGAHF